MEGKQEQFEIAGNPLEIVGGRQCRWDPRQLRMNQLKPFLDNSVLWTLFSPASSQAMGQIWVSWPNGVHKVSIIGIVNFFL